MNGEAVLGIDGKYTTFTYNEKVISFRTSKSLEKYTKIIEWDNGYIVVLAVYNGKEVEDYIDLLPILDNLLIDRSFLDNIKKVKIDNGECENDS